MSNQYPKAEYIDQILGKTSDGKGHAQKTSRGEWIAFEINFVSNAPYAYEKAGYALTRDLLKNFIGDKTRSRANYSEIT